MPYVLSCALQLGGLERTSGLHTLTLTDNRLCSLLVPQLINSSVVGSMLATSQPASGSLAGSPNVSALHSCGGSLIELEVSGNPIGSVEGLQVCLVGAKCCFLLV